jgi:hypothetical protein
VQDPLLYWYYISSVEKHAGDQFWRLDVHAKTRLHDVRYELCRSNHSCRCRGACNHNFFATVPRRCCPSCVTLPDARWNAVSALR